ncbi:hypothetical protein [Caballeronia cordobensis]|uniref:hypothetical protein n=1 Tax=Caballeronia cordobensis TaxID=1353886 RepID=UPI00045EDF80|nr:hypothetical protein BRPE67_ACDS28450 [Burkholderia sp. RPE67]
MKVLVVGSDRKRIEAGNGEPFKQACRELGASLVKANIEIVIASDSSNTADCYVLEGAAQIEGRHRIWILRPGIDEIPFSKHIVTYSARFEFIPKRINSPTWSAGRIAQIQAADAVLLIGGGNGTRTVGYMAPALEHPVLLIGSFGGAARELWPEMEPFYNHLGDLSERVLALRQTWHSSHADLATQAIEELVKRRLFKLRPRLPLGVYLSMLVTCLFVWVILFANPWMDIGESPSSAVYFFFGILAVAGILGTLLRNNLRLIFDPTAKFSWNEMLIELGAGLVLGFTLSLLYLASAITVAGTTKALLIPKDKDSFQRAAVVMTLLGLGGGLMIEQAADRVRHWFTDELRH